MVKMHKPCKSTTYSFFCEPGGTQFANRKAIKAMTFTVLFSDNRFIGQPEAEAKRIFRGLFPTVYEIFRLIKKRSAANLPILLQRMESNVILDHVAKRISLEHPEMPLFPVHDSVVCPVGMAAHVVSVMEEEFKRLLGIKPMVRCEFWRPSDRQW